MSISTAPPPQLPLESKRRKRVANPAVSVISQGEPFAWLMGGALAVCVVMVASLLAMIVYFGSGTFWPLPVERFRLTQMDADGQPQAVVYMGEVMETAPLAEPQLDPPSPGEPTGGPAGESSRNIPPQPPASPLRMGALGWSMCLLLAVLVTAVAILWFLVDDRLAGRLGSLLATILSVGLIAWSGYQLAQAPWVQVGERYKVRTGNFQLTNTHFTWLLSPEIQERTQPQWAVVLERQEYGRFYGFPAKFLIDGKTIADEPSQVWAQFEEHHGAVLERMAQIKSLVHHDIGELNAEQEQARLTLSERQLELTDAEDDRRRLELQLRQAKRASINAAQIAPLESRLQELEQEVQSRQGLVSAAEQAFQETEESARLKTERIQEQLTRLRQENEKYVMQLTTAQGQASTLTLDQIVRAYPANQLGLFGQLGVYLSRWREFIFDDPREANAEGGVFPAIVGTVAMTLIMAIAVVPFGVLAALYLREYAKGGFIVSLVRIAINNLAGVPSIVFGVFGLGFFCYIIGAFVDGGPDRINVTPLPPTSWWLVMLVLAATGTAAFMLGILSAWQQKARRNGTWLPALRAVALVLWLAAVVAFFVLIFTNPFFNGMYRAKLQTSPTFGTGGMLWASLTLALLTLPVVIVSTEEALASVPNSMREGSYACGASKWQTIRRIVLPRAMPGIMTGMILAMARGAGEVAPLMLVGASKLALELPVNSEFPFVHGSQTFMHLGFHIYDVGFQSQNSEAARPLVFTTTLLLILIIALLNIASVWLRARLRRKFVSSAF